MTVGSPAETDLLLELSLEDKISLLTGADYWSLHGHPGIGLRSIRTSDGSAGVRRPRWDERDTALNVPAPVALAATWDPRRAELIGSLRAAESGRKEVDVLLAPTVNLQRSPLGGRNFEFLGEDPLLTATMGTALVRGIGLNPRMGRKNARTVAVGAVTPTVRTAPCV